MVGRLLPPMFNPLHLIHSRTDGMGWGPSRVRDVSNRPFLKYPQPLCFTKGIFILSAERM